MKLLIHDVRAIIEGQLMPLMRVAVLEQARLLSAASGEGYLLRTNAIEREITSAYRGPERLGLDLPIMHLAAISKSPGEFHAVGPAAQPQLVAPPLAALVRISVQSGGMLATLADLQPALLLQPAYLERPPWELLLSGLGIDLAQAEDALAEFLPRLKAAAASGPRRRQLSSRR